MEKESELSENEGDVERFDLYWERRCEIEDCITNELLKYDFTFSNLMLFHPGEEVNDIEYDD